MSKVGKIAKGVAIGLVLAIILNIALMAVIWFVGLRKYYKPPKELQAVATASLGDLSGKVSDKTLQQLISEPEAGCYMSGSGDASANSVAIAYDAIVTPVSEAVTNVPIASVLFIVEWDTAA